MYLLGTSYQRLEKAKMSNYKSLSLQNALGITEKTKR